MTTDAEGNVIVIGYFGLSGSATQATVDFDPGPGVANLTNTGGWDPFIWKLDANGNFLWARTFGSTTPNTATDERCWDVAVDADGNIFVSGFITGTYDLDAGASVASFTSAGEKDAFFVKYDGSGNYFWGFTIPDTGDLATSIKENSVAVDTLGHVFLAGHFNGTADFDPGAGTANLTSAGNADMFIARYDLNGTYQTAVRIGGTLNDTSPPGTVRCDANNNLFMTGRFRGTVDLNPGAGTNNVTNAGTTDNIWVASYDANLAYRWGFGIASGNGLDGGHRVDFDPTGSGLYIAGWFSGVTDFDGGSGIYNLTSINNATGAASDIFIAKYGRDTGAFLWARGFGGTVTDQTQLSITAGLAVDNDGNAYVTGQLYGTNISGYDSGGKQSDSPSWDSVGLNDGYIIKYDRNGKLWRPSELDDWRKAYFDSMANEGPGADDADADNDGSCNLLEYATGTSPRVATAAPVESALSNGYLTIGATKAPVGGVVWSAESSGDLLTWSPLTTTVLADGPNTFQARDNFAVGAGGKRFLRLIVTRQ
jgi:hypothetical protein